MKQMIRVGKIIQPRRPALRARRTSSAKVMRIISGQMWRRTVASFGSGSDLSFGLKIRYDLEKVSIQRKVLLGSYLEAPHESERTEMQKETIWVLLTWPVLSTITNCQTKYYDHKLKDLICFKRVVELRSRPPVEVLPDIRLGSKADQNSLATRH